MKEILYKRCVCESQSAAIKYKGSYERIPILSRDKTSTPHFISHNVIGYIIGHIAMPWSEISNSYIALSLKRTAESKIQCTGSGKN